MAKQPTSFRRLFSNRDLARGSARASMIWSALSALLLVDVLFMLFITAFLLVTGGNLAVSGSLELAEEISRLTGQDPSNVAELMDGDPDHTDEVHQIQFENRGLLPVVWWSRDHLWGGLLAWKYRNITLLQENSSALLLLIMASAMVWFLREITLSRATSLRIRAAREVTSRLRQQLHRQTMRLGPGDLSRHEQRRVMDLFTTETDRLRDALLTRLETLGKSLPELVFLSLLVLDIDPLLAIQAAIPLGACWFIADRERQRVDELRKKAAVSSELDLRLLAEDLDRTQIVSGYGVEDLARTHFEKNLERFQSDSETLVRDVSLKSWGYRVLVLLGVSVVGCLVAGKVLLASPPLGLAPAMLMTAALACMYSPLRSLWNLKSADAAASITANLVYRYLDEIPPVSQAVGAKFFQPLSKTLEWKNVSYMTPQKKPLLQGVQLKIEAGEQVAIVATDPLEARALASMLPRFIEPQSGQVLLDQEDIAWATLESLRAEILFVGGDDPCFTGTVLENIRFGNSKFSLTDLTEAAKMVHAHHFILKLPQGYETVIGEHGETLTPSQNFRLGLARAIARNPALLIIEEPTHPLDADAKSLLDDAYQRIQANRTILYLPARLATLRRADRIILLHQGAVHAIGNHAQLVKSSPLYRHWEYVHFNEFRHQTDGANGG